MRTILVAAVALAACSGDKRPADPGPRAPPAPIDARTQLGGIEVPAVPAPGLLPLDNALTIAATQTEIIVDGRAIVGLTGAAVDPSDLEGGANGRKIAKLAAYVAALPMSTPDPLVVLVLDRRLPMTLLVQIIYSVKAVGIKRFGIAALGDGAPMMLPITLPERPSASALDHDITFNARGGPDADLGPPLPVRPVISITKDKVILWSISGILGSLEEPRLRHTDLATAAVALTKVLAGFVASRWAGGQRSEREREAVVMADSGVPVQTFVELAAAVRADAGGAELFPSVILSMGLE